MNYPSWWDEECGDYNADYAWKADKRLQKFLDTPGQTWEQYLKLGEAK